MHKETSDSKLLERFRQKHDPKAFETIVARHLGMVLGVAQRKTGDPSAAEEIAQNTFVVLAKKVEQLKPDMVLGGWLHRVTTLEAAEYNRREYRRRNIVKRFKEASEVEHDPMETKAFAEYLPDLDDALNKLSKKDHDVIMLRFHSGMRFGEIAKQLGKSEDAVRKQVARALEKLAILLGQRQGTTAASALLVAGLPHAFTKSTAATMVSSIADNALVASPASVAGVPLTLQLLTLMKTQFGIMAVIGILLVSGSFLAGRHSAAGFGQQLTREVEANALRRHHLARRAKSGSPAPPSSLQTPLRTVKQILADAVANLHNDSSATGWHRVRLILEEIDSTEYAEAIAHLETHRTDRDAFQTIGALLAGLWAGTDGENAIAWVEENLPRRGVGFQNVLEMWSLHSPEDAYTWYREKGDSGDTGMPLQSFRWLAGRVFGGWAEHDPVGAVGALENVAVEDERGAIDGFARAVRYSSNPEPILQAIASMNESPLRNRLIQEVAESWAEEELHSAVAWLDEIPMASARARVVAKTEVAEEWFKRRPDDLLHVGAWLLAGAPDDLRERLTEMMNEAMAQQNLQEHRLKK